MARPLDGSPEWLVSLVTLTETRVEMAMTLEDAVDAALRFEKEADQLGVIGDVTIAEVRWVNLKGREVPA